MVSRPEPARMRILFVASDRMEFKGMLRHATDVLSTSVPVDWARTAKLNGNDVMLVANGIGPKRAGAATAAGIEAFAPDAVVSTGFCGALATWLQVADVIVADR